MRVEEVVEGAVYLDGWRGVFEVTGLKKVRNNSLSPEVTMVVGNQWSTSEDEETGMKTIVSTQRELRPRDLGGSLAGPNWRKELEAQAAKHNLDMELRAAVSDFLGFRVHLPHDLTAEQKRAVLAKLKRRTKR